VLLIAIGLTVFVILRRRRNKEKQLINEQLQKDRLNEALIKTLINIAHEIRTPLSLIISPLDRLSSMGDDERHNKMYVTMRHSANRILMLINQLLSLRKMEKGCFKLTFSETDIVEYIMDILPMFEVQFQEKDIKFHITKHIKSGQLCAYIDTNNFDKIIINLLSNAVKFTPKGGSISLDITENDNSYTISVKDSGIGLTKEDIAHLFERFYQATSSTAGVNVGTGIGLHFTHELVTLHHGSIAVENNADVPGTTFSVNMPLGREHLNDSEIVEDVTPAIKAEAIVPHEIDYLDPETVHNRRSYRIMVIDDDEDMLNYINYELSSDFKVSTFNNGKEAIKAIAEVNPDIIISDIMMPDFDGMALCRKLNNNINTNHIPVILLTADSREEMQREALRNGADYYLTKPINVETLKCVVYRLIEQREKLKNIYKGHQETEVQSDIVKVTDYEEQFIKRVDEAIIKNIGNSEFSVEQLADAVGVGRVHLYRKIKSYSNQSPRDYIRNVRLKCSQILSSTFLRLHSH
jgi:CheY-like chemotaxis protein